MLLTVPICQCKQYHHCH